MVTKLSRLAAELSRFVAHGTGASAKPFGYAAQRRSNGLTDVVGGLHGTCGGAPADAFQALLDRPQAPFDFTDIGGHRAGISGPTEHQGILKLTNSGSVLSALL